jgi:long-chain acyl-CoA synthetase
MSQTWQSIPQLFFAQAARWESRPLVYGKPHMHWCPLTWRQVAQRSLCIASGLVELGVNSGDRIAIWMKSSPEWMLCDLGSLSAGCANVPIHESASDAELTYLLRDSESIGVFVQDQQQAERIKRLKQLLPDLAWIVIVHPHRALASLSISLNPEAQHLEAVKASYFLRNFNLISDDDLSLEEHPHTIHFHHLDKLEEMIDHHQEVQKRLASITPQDILTLQYTSGTTGEPKGVILTHRNILSNCESALEAVPITPDDVLLSFLPLSHSFERVAGYYMPTLYGGATLYFSEGLGRLIRNLNEVSPTVMTGVPRIYEKIYARFRGARGAQGKVRKALTSAALTLNPSETKVRSQSGLTSLINEGRKWINRQLFSEFRERLGGRLRFMVSGGAPLDEHVAQFFNAAGLLILEGYGLSETSPVLTVNRPHAYRFGSVGKPLNGVQLRIAVDGEILVKGPNVTQGYHQKPSETAKLFNSAGWLLTGDIGHFDQDGFLFITDRKKDIFKTASGKMVAPQYIERLFNGSPLIEQTYVIGDQRPFCVALLVPSLLEVNAWAQDIGYLLPQEGRISWGTDKQIRSLFEKEVELLNKRLSRHETIKRFYLCPESFEADELTTPSLKLKRTAALKAYANEIATLYGDKLLASKLKG